jgi:hypothetical protein
VTKTATHQFYFESKLYYETTFKVELAVLCGWEKYSYKIQLFCARRLCSARRVLIVKLNAMPQME